MAKIRDDLVGVVSVGGLNLGAGDVVPDGVTVGDHVLAQEKAEKPAEPQQEPTDGEPEAEKPKRRNTRRKTEGE